MSEPTFGAIVPAYNTADMTLQCIEALLSGSAAPRSTIIVDNGRDGTAECVRERRLPGVRVIDNASNVGFAYAINQASSALDEPFILWLNSDVILGPDTASNMLAESAGRHEVAAFGPEQSTPDGRELPSTFQFPSAFRPFARRGRRGPQANVVATDEFLSGACLFVRRTAWDDVGQLDESFFFYWEDADWQYRAVKAGWELATLSSQVVHQGSGSGDPGSREFRLVSYEGYERFIRKHEGRAALVLHRATNVPGVVVEALGRHGDGSATSDQCEAHIARARLIQILQPIPSRDRSRWAAALAEESA